MPLLVVYRYPVLLHILNLLVLTSNKHITFVATTHSCGYRALRPFDYLRGQVLVLHLLSVLFFLDFSLQLGRNSVLTLH